MKLTKNITLTTFKLAIDCHSKWHIISQKIFGKFLPTAIDWSDSFVKCFLRNEFCSPQKDDKVDPMLRAIGQSLINDKSIRSTRMSANRIKQYFSPKSAQSCLHPFQVSLWKRWPIPILILKTKRWEKCLVNYCHKRRSNETKFSYLFRRRNRKLIHYLYLVRINYANKVSIYQDIW